MEAQFYLTPDDQSFIDYMVALPLKPNQKMQVRFIHVQRIWVDQKTKEWQIDFSSMSPMPEELLRTVGEQLVTTFHLKEVFWKRTDPCCCAVDDGPDCCDGSTPPPYTETPVAPEPGQVPGGSDFCAADGLPPACPPCDMPEEPVEEEACCDDLEEERRRELMQNEKYRRAYDLIHGKKQSDGHIYGKRFKGKVRPLGEIREEENNVVVEGILTKGRDKDDKMVTFYEKELRTKSVLLRMNLVDDTGGIYLKQRFESWDEVKKLEKQLHAGMRIRVCGDVAPDRFEFDEMVMTFKGIKAVPTEERSDNAPVKRVELHCHTKMSKLDAVTPMVDLVNQAIKFGHKALAITDHGVIQAFPFCADAVEEAGSDLKLIYGCEGYVISNEHGRILKENLPKPGKIPSNHIIILAKNEIGLRNLYKLVSLGHLNYLNGNGARARGMLPKEVLEECREGLLFGSACEAGEVYRAIEAGVSDEQLEEIASFYDYLEVQPLGNNSFLERMGRFTRKELMAHNRKVYDLAKKLGKLCCATCDVHFLNPEDAKVRAILQFNQGYKDADMQAPLYYRTTEEMLAEFEYMGKDIAYEICVENPNKIAEQVKRIKPVPDRDQLYSPSIPGAEEAIRDMSYEKAHNLYGDVLPKIVEDRLKYELDAIINNGYAVLYDIAQKLVKHSMEEGYLVGSRGSVGSSFVAFTTDITEVNPLKPHYRCPNCRHTEFFLNNEYVSGFDMPEKDCPECGTPMVRDGHDIPFAVFMGFHGDKVPDIDLNFSDEYQHYAHKYTEELFGRDNVCRAGTIGTLAPKTAWSYVKKYFEEHEIPAHPAYIDSFVEGLNGVKRTTGQHPAGIMVIPRDMDIHYITPMNHPADDRNSPIITTHYDYHSINDRLVKLDILGHVDPTMIKRLEEFTGIDAMSIPIGDPDTMAIFSSPEILGVTEEQIGTKVGTYGIPECGTRFTQAMIYELQPKKFSDVVRVSGYSHGTDVWVGNAQKLIEEGKPVENTISTRDDVMTYLISKGVPESIAFKTMEFVRKGKAAKKGLEPEMREAMEKAGIPDWYMESCETVKYLFPKAHAVAYVLMAYRIAYCKVHYPLAYYAAYFTQRAEVDATFIAKGKEYMRQYIRNVEAQGFKAKPKDKETVIYLQLVIEMLERGFEFYPIDLYKSHPYMFMPEGDKGIRIPLCALPGVGKGVGKTLALAVKEEARDFISQEDLISACRSVEQKVMKKLLASGLPADEALPPEERDLTHVGQSALDSLSEYGALGDMPVSSQTSLF